MGRLAQLGEHQLDKLGVTGSSPVPPTSRKPAPGAGFRVTGLAGVRRGCSLRGCGGEVRRVWIRPVDQTSLLIPSEGDDPPSWHPRSSPGGSCRSRGVRRGSRSFGRWRGTNRFAGHAAGAGAGCPRGLDSQAPRVRVLSSAAQPRETRAFPLRSPPLLREPPLYQAVPRARRSDGDPSGDLGAAGWTAGEVENGPCVQSGSGSRSGGSEDLRRHVQFRHPPQATDQRVGVASTSVASLSLLEP